MFFQLGQQFRAWLVAGDARLAVLERDVRAFGVAAPDDIERVGVGVQNSRLHSSSGSGGVSVKGAKFLKLALLASLDSWHS